MAGLGATAVSGADVSHSTLGLIGLGRIGKAMIPHVASVCECSIGIERLTPEEETELQVTYCELDELLQQSDFVSLHVAQNDDTHLSVHGVR